MNVEQLCWPSVVSIASEEPLLEAIWRMREFDVGALPVIEEETVIGIVTDAVLRASAEAAATGEARDLRDLERTMGFEPTTPTLATRLLQVSGDQPSSAVVSTSAGQGGFRLDDLQGCEMEFMGNL